MMMMMYDLCDDSFTPSNELHQKTNKLEKGSSPFSLIKQPFIATKQNKDKK